MAHIFHHKGLEFFIRDDDVGRSDEGIIANCMSDSGFSYWRHGPYSGVVIDVGAHIGGFACAVAKTAEKVYAYEARDENFKFLQKNKKLNNLKNIVCLRRAVGIDGVAVLGIESQYGSSSLINPSGRATESVRGVMLPEMLGGIEEVCLLKSDCEGGEYGLFLGQPPELIRKIKVISAEIHWHPDHSHNDLINYIIDCGYEGPVRNSRAASCKMVDFIRID